MKENSRAFLLYGALGLDSEDSYGFLRCLTEVDRADVRSLIAVRDTINTLYAIGEDECAEAVECIYFRQRKKRPAAADISSAVQRFALGNYLDERSVYRRLEKAGKIYSAHLENGKRIA